MTAPKIRILALGFTVLVWFTVGAVAYLSYVR